MSDDLDDEIYGVDEKGPSSELAGGDPTPPPQNDDDPPEENAPYVAPPISAPSSLAPESTEQEDEEEAYEPPDDEEEAAYEPPDDMDEDAYEPPDEDIVYTTGSNVNENGKRPLQEDDDDEGEEDDSDDDIEIVLDSEALPNQMSQPQGQQSQQPQQQSQSHMHTQAQNVAQPAQDGAQSGQVGNADVGRTKNTGEKPSPITRPFVRISSLPRSDGTLPPPNPPPSVPTPSVDLNEIGLYDSKSVFDLDLDSLEEKPWQKPGADVTDYFNYGFCEQSWKEYVKKQREIRAEIGVGLNAVKTDAGPDFLSSNLAAGQMQDPLNPLALSHLQHLQHPHHPHHINSPGSQSGDLPPFMSPVGYHGIRGVRRPRDDEASMDGQASGTSGGSPMGYMPPPHFDPGFAGFPPPEFMHFGHRGPPPGFMPDMMGPGGFDGPGFRGGGSGGKGLIPGRSLPSRVPPPGRGERRPGANLPPVPPGGIPGAAGRRW
ncbi:hypothetical protein DFS34DRAFT_673537 [Phlyctochytrium arcticum]|nr:hypothetical protein DFS34DRAFT_673537 [Phlyctochytrium arcticum]